jgi:hypothetical protein
VSSSLRAAKLARSLSRAANLARSPLLLERVVPAPELDRVEDDDVAEIPERVDGMMLRPRKIASLPHLLSVTFSFHAWRLLNAVFVPMQLVPAIVIASAAATRSFFMFEVLE